MNKTTKDIKTKLDTLLKLNRKRKLALDKMSKLLKPKNEICQATNNEKT